MATNIIDAISNLEVGKTMTVNKVAAGKYVAHKVTLAETAERLTAEKQDLDYTHKGISSFSSSDIDELKSLNLNSGKFKITRIEYNGFYNYNWTEGKFIIYLPDLESIEDGGFSNCTMRSFNAPNVKEIGMEAFCNCLYLESIELDEIANIPQKSFWGCNALTQAYFNQVTCIEYGGFADCQSLAYISIPNVEFIYGDAFAGCAQLTSLEITKAKTISDQAFNYSGIVEINLSASSTMTKEYVQDNAQYWWFSYETVEATIHCYKDGITYEDVIIKLNVE